MTAKAKNQAYTNILMGALRGQTKRLMARAVTVGYSTALRDTFQDSGRAAYNWRLKIGASESFHTADWYQAPRPSKAGPLKYGSGKTATRYSARPSHPVGYQGEGRDSNASSRRIVVNYRMKEVGLDNYAYTNPSTFSRTALYERLGAGRAGGVTKVTLYNPIFSPMNQGYVDNAFNRMEGGRGRDVAERIKAEVDKAIAQEKFLQKVKR